VPKLRHLDDLGTARFVTFSCWMRLPGLREPNAMPILAEEVVAARLKYRFALLGYVFMPEHVHLVILPPEQMELGRVMGEIKSKMARRYFALTAIPTSGSKRVFWDKRCYDHNCRSSQAVAEKIRYCHNNPVTRGLVSDPADWKWSSYNAYHGRLDVPLTVQPVPA
jgi:putative transposase